MKGRIECIAPGKGNHGPVKVDGTYNFKYADGTRYYPVGTTSYDFLYPEQYILSALSPYSARESHSSSRTTILPGSQA